MTATAGSRIPLLIALLALPLLGCTDDSSDARSAATTATTTKAATTTTGAPRPDGPAAAFTPLTVGTIVPPLTVRPGPSLPDAGYSDTEYAAAGTATAYQSAGDLPTDGKFVLTPSTEAPYNTRAIVRRPEDPAEFNGTVVVEWLNVSSGADADPDYTYFSDEVVRNGYAWVGVSAQRIGIEGGPVLVPVAVNPIAGKGIKTVAPDRYADLHHPGDAYSYDIFTQVGRAVRAAADGTPFEGLDVQHVLADGESQSAYMLTTYADGVQPLTGAYDGFLIHSRGGAAAPLGTPDEGVDLAGSMGGKPTLIRDDLDVPVMMVQTETDVLGALTYFPARQPDTDRIRLWEMAGTAHADQYQIGPAEPSLGCSLPINNGQQAFVMRAALRHLDEWVGSGKLPPKADRLATAGIGAQAKFVLDDNGNVTGGVRTPVVDAPVDVLSGLPSPNSSIACIIAGSTTPIPADKVVALYPTDADYRRAYGQAMDDGFDAGFLLEDDRDAILDGARSSALSGG